MLNDGWLHFTVDIFWWLYFFSISSNQFLRKYFLRLNICKTIIKPTALIDKLNGLGQLIFCASFSSSEYESCIYSFYTFYQLWDSVNSNENKSKDKLYIEILKIIVNIMQGKQVPTFIISLVILLLSKFMPQIISSTNVSDTHRAQHLQTWTSGQGTSEMHCLLSKHTLFSGDIQRGTVVRGQETTG